MNVTIHEGQVYDIGSWEQQDDTESEPSHPQSSISVHEFNLFSI